MDRLVYIALGLVVAAHMIAYAGFSLFAMWLGGVGVVLDIALIVTAVYFSAGFVLKHTQDKAPSSSDNIQTKE